MKMSNRNLSLAGIILAGILITFCSLGRPIGKNPRSENQIKSVTIVPFAVGTVFPLKTAEKLEKTPKLIGFYADPVRKIPDRKATVKVLNKAGASDPTDTFEAQWIRAVPLFDKKSLKGKRISTLLNENPNFLKNLKLDKMTMQGQGDLAGYEFYLMKPEISGITAVSSVNLSFTVSGKYFGTKAPTILVEYLDRNKNVRYKRCRVDRNKFVYKDARGKPSAMDANSGDSQVTAYYPNMKETDEATGYVILDNKVGLAAFEQAPSGQVKLTMAVLPDGAGTTSPQIGSSFVPKNEERNITATASEGYVFTGWTATENAILADADSSNAVATLSGDAVVTANFQTESAIRFNGIQFGHATGTDQISLVWAAAVNEKNKDASFTYFVYRGTEDDVSSVYQESNLVATVADSGTESSVSDLAAATEYFFLVVAEDDQGERNRNHDLASVTTMTDPLEIETVPIDIETETSGNVIVSGDEKTVTIGSDETATISPDSIIILPDLDEIQNTLKKVTDISYAGGITTLTVEDVSLDEVFLSGDLNSSALLTDPENLPEQSVDELRKTREKSGMANGTLFLEYRQMAEEGRRAYLDPKERFMIVREEEEKSVELMAGVSFTPELRFEPRFQTLAQWKNRAWAPDRLDMAAVIFGGKLTLGGEIAFEASAEVSDPYTTGKMYLWKKPRTMKFKYLVGAVPVYQEVMLNFVCEADFQPKAALEMSAEMTMTKDVKCAIRWTRGLGWNTSKTDGFERSVSYSVKVKGGAVFNFKIYPEVSVRFYRTLTGTLAVKPKLTLNAEMEADLLDLAMSQFTKFDLGIGADVQMGAKFACFSKSVAEKETDDIEILAPINFFTLPELEFVDPPNSGDLNKEIPLQVKITDGTNNKFDQLSATWFVSPNTNTILTPVGVTEIGKGEYTDDAKLTATANNTYNVYYSMQGNGFLGEMGKRIVKTPITLGADDLAKCDSIDVRLWNRNVPVTYEWTQHEATDTETTYHCLIDYISADYFNGERFERDKVKWSGKNFSYSYDGTTLPGQSGQIIRTGTSASGDTRFKISINGSIDASGNLSGTFSLRSDNYSPDFSATEYDIYQADFTLANVPLAESELIDVGGGTGDMLMVYRYKIYSSTASAQVSMSGAVWNDLHPYDNGSGTWLSTDWSKAKDEPVGWVHLYYYYKK